MQPGFVALVTPDGQSRIVADDIAFPNGMAITSDNRTLVVAVSYRHQLIGFDIGADGGLSGRRVWADLGDAAPDGICLDAEGAAWYADVPHEHCVRVAEGAQVLETVSLDRGGFACMLGGVDGANLYVVGARWPGWPGSQGTRRGRASAAHQGQRPRCRMASPLRSRASRSLIPL